MLHFYVILRSYFSLVLPTHDRIGEGQTLQNFSLVFLFYLVFTEEVYQNAF